MWIGKEAKKLILGNVGLTFIDDDVVVAPEEEDEAVAPQSVFISFPSKHSFLIGLKLSTHISILNEIILTIADRPPAPTSI